MAIRESLSRRVFLKVNVVFLLLLSVACLMPMIHVLAVSLSSESAVDSGVVGLWPVKFTLDPYRYVMAEQRFFTAFGVTVRRTLLGVCIQMVVTVLAAYPMSKRQIQFHARPFYVAYFMAAMLFSGGLIPNYLAVRYTGLINTIWALVIPGAVPVFNIILVQNFMKGLPDEISESAFIDGAGHWRTLLEIILPLSKASLATVTLFCAVGHWNAYFDGMLYMNKSTYYPLQTYLRSLVVIEDFNLEANAEDITRNVTQESSRCAQIFVAMVPILCVYPFLQKHFTKGIVMGSVKG